MQKRLTFLLFACLMHISSFSQESLGIHLDNYSGINSTNLNPAGYAFTPYGWDINLIGGSSFFENNYAFIKPARLGDMLHHPDNMKVYFGPDITNENQVPKGEYFVDFYQKVQPRFAQISNSLMGPSFYIRLNPNHSIGLVTRARMMGNGNGVSNTLSYYEYDPQPFFEDFKVDPFHLGVMGWSEIGLNYSYRTETNNGRMAFGLTAKYLDGYEAAYWTNDNPFQLTKLPGDSLSGSALDFTYGYTNTNIANDNYSLQSNGRGMSVDLGFVYAQTNGNEDYQWKLGVSVLDIGSIKFDRNAKAHRVQTDELSIVGTEVYQNIESAEDFEDKIRVFSEQMLGDPNASLVAEEFNMWLPTALSVQFDAALAPSLYLGSALVQPIPLGAEGVRRKSLLAVAPRYESKWFGASLPITFYNWQSLRTGLAVRLAFLTIGTDNLGSLVRRKDLSGYDLYFAIKVNPFGFGNGNGGGRAGKVRGGAGRGKQLPCYQFQYMDIDFKCLTFAELTTEQLYQLMALRQQVFVVEQNCPYLDADGKDQAAWHVLGYDQQQNLVAYARLLPKGVSYEKYASIGRVVNAESVRGKGIGRILMQQCLGDIQKLCPGDDIKISAQVYLIRFYESLGFQTIGSEYLEDDIPHIGMLKSA